MDRQPSLALAEPRFSATDRAKWAFGCSEAHRRASRAATNCDPWRAQAGVATIESAITIGALVIAFIGVMEILGAGFESDRMDRAAQVAARVLALDKTILTDRTMREQRACEAIRDELQLDPAFDCWTAWPESKIQPEVNPSELPATLDLTKDPATFSGEMVLVRIGWSRAPLSFEHLPGSVPMVAMGLARAEP